MRTRNWRLIAVLCALMVSLMGSHAVLAQCAVAPKMVKPTALHLQMGGAHLMLAAYDNDEKDPSIVGMWHAVLTAQALNGASIPDTVVDNSLTIWHSDGTDIIISSRPPQDGQVCLGVWKQTGRYNYLLNHIPWLANDTTNAPAGIGDPAGPARLVESITLNRDGNHYSGTFTLTATDTSFNPTATFTGTVSATRITTDTTLDDLK